MIDEIERNEQGSRNLIMTRLRELKSRGYDWVDARDVLFPFTPKGPWSEDLQALVSEGLVESAVSVECMSHSTKVRLR